MPVQVKRFQLIMSNAVTSIMKRSSCRKPATVPFLWWSSHSRSKQAICDLGTRSSRKSPQKLRSRGIMKSVGFYGSRTVCLFFKFTTSSLSTFSQCGGSNPSSRFIRTRPLSLRATTSYSPQIAFLSSCSRTGSWWTLFTQTALTNIQRIWNFKLTTL